MAAFDAILARLPTLFPREIDLALDRIEVLLHRLGDPHEALPPVIHVAGTNGKGSTVAMLRACLEATGAQVHVYTSPHLVSFTERIRLAGSLIAEDALAVLLEEVERVNDGAPITFFEITSAAAYLGFARVPADVVLLETGLGGRLDPTNLIAAPAVTAITKVAMDHVRFLGDTLPKIAREKAGILKPGRPGVIGRQAPESLAVIEARAAEISAPLHRFGREWEAEPRGGTWHFQGQRWSLDLPLPVLPGRHQIDNAGIAVAALERLDGIDVTPAAIAAGLARTEWPARLQRLAHGPLAQSLPPGWEQNLPAQSSRAAVASWW